MLRKMMFVVAMMALLVVTGCSSKQRTTVHALTGQDVDLTARVGVITENEGLGGTEVGFTAKYARSSEIAWGPEPDLVGGYLLFHLTQEVSIEDLPDRSPVAGLLEALHARPYAGLELVGPIDGEQRKVQPNWIVGTKFTIAPVSNWALLTEYVDGDEQDGELSIGIMGKF